MRTSLLILLTFFIISPVLSQDNSDGIARNNFEGPVNQFMYGKIESISDGEAYHYIHLEKL